MSLWTLENGTIYGSFFPMLAFLSQTFSLFFPYQVSGKPGFRASCYGTRKAGYLPSFLRNRCTDNSDEPKSKVEDRKKFSAADAQ